MGLGLQASDGICLVSLSQHDGKRLVVLPASRQVDVGVQEITDQRIRKGGVHYRDGRWKRGKERERE